MADRFQLELFTLKEEIEDENTKRSFELVELAFRNLVAVLDKELKTVTTTYLMEPSDSVILADATGGIFTVSLPAVDEAKNQHYSVKKVDAVANVTVDTPDSADIDGASTSVLSSQWDVVTVVSDGTDWFTL